MCPREYSEWRDQGAVPPHTVWWAQTRRGGFAMVSLEFDPKESSMMNEILQSYLSDLRLEIADTEKMSFREDLKKKEVFIKDVMQRIEKGLIQ
jgi:hypothetical protein